VYRMARTVPEPVTLHGVMFIRFRPPPDRLAMPDVCCDLVWTREQLILCGPASRGHRISWPNEDVQLLNIDPLVARAWLGVPLTHFVDHRVPLQEIRRDLCGPIAQLFHSGQAAKLVRSPRLSFQLYARASLAAAAIRRGLRLELAAARVAWSARQLERVFADHFGLTPRAYRRITRMRHAIEAAKSGQTLADAALSAGYADQSHFTREVRELMGHSPCSVIPNVGKLQDAHAYAREY
jgi:AraC-like DNA-binding protein